MPIRTDEVVVVYSGSTDVARVYFGDRQRTFGLASTTVALDSSYYIEAEAYSSAALFGSVFSTDAVGGFYMEALADTGGLMKFDIPNMKAGTYTLAGNVYWPSFSANSFAVSVNTTAAPVTWDKGTVTTGFELDTFGTISLQTSDNVLYIHSLESSAGIDYLTVVASSNVTATATSTGTGGSSLVSVDSYDGSVGVLQKHTTSNALLTGVANGWGALEPPESLGGDYQIVNVPAHPHPNRTDVLRVEWNSGIPQYTGGSRVEIAQPRDENGALYNETNGTDIYHAMAVYVDTSFAWPDDNASTGASKFGIIYGSFDGGVEDYGTKFQIRDTGELIMRQAQGTTPLSMSIINPLPRGTWLSLAWRTYFHSQDGFVDAWYSTEGSTSFSFAGRSGPTNNNNGGASSYAKMGIYLGDGQAGTYIGWYTNLVRGTGLSSVILEAFGKEVVP